MRSSPKDGCCCPTWAPPRFQSWLATHPEGADRAYRRATALLLRLQALELTEAERAALPVYDAAFFRRGNGPVHRVAPHAACGTGAERRWDQAVLERSFALITAQCGAAAGYVHRDFHSRNPWSSRLNTQLDLGLLDFQDAVWGPVTMTWRPAEGRLCALGRGAAADWGIRHWEAMRKAGLPVDSDFRRVLAAAGVDGPAAPPKILGIFARLSIRDAKPQYLADIPRVWQAAYQVCARYSGLGPWLACWKGGGRASHTGYTLLRAA